MNRFEDERASEPPDGLEQDDAVIGLAFRQSALVGIVITCVVAGFLIWKNLPEHEELAEPREVAAVEIREMPDVELPLVPLTDVTRAAGITFVHQNGAAGEKLLPETMGGGCAFWDFDGDDDPDILFVNSRKWAADSGAGEATLALYENDGTGKFTEVTSRVGLGVTLYGMGCAIGDFDNDGYSDLFVSAVGPNRLFRNVRGERFEEVTQAAGVAGDATDWSTSCGWLDYDRDGDLDLFVANYVVWNRELDLAQPFTIDGKRRAYGRPQEFRGTFPYLYRNDGQGRFTDVSAEAGVQVRNPATGDPLAKSLGVTFADFNGDGWLDIAVANDTVQNLLFMNRRDGHFDEVGGLANIAFDTRGNARGAMGIDVGHFRNTSSQGVAIGNFSNEMTALYVSQQLGADLPQFNDEAISNGIGPVTRLELTFGVFFLDVDLDGRLDLFASNGHLEEDISLVQGTQTYEQPPQLLWNCGPEQLTEFVPLDADQLGAECLKPMVGRGAACADIDLDGDLDILITATGRAPRLLRNDQQLGNHWIQFRLIGRMRDAIGARVEVQTNAGLLTRLVMPTRSYLSQFELPVTFGLGKRSIESVRVFWPDGTEQKVDEFQIDARNTIQQVVAE